MINIQKKHNHNYHNPLVILPPSIFVLFLYRYFYYIFLVWRHEFPVFFAVFAESTSGSFVWCDVNIYVFISLFILMAKGVIFFFFLFSQIIFSFLLLVLVLLISSGAWTTSEKCVIPIQIVYLRTFYCHSIMCEGCNGHIYEDKVVAGASMSKWARVCQSMHSRFS